MSTVKKPMHATRMSMILTGILIALLCILFGGSVFAATRLLEKSQEATHAQIDADVSADDPSRLAGLKKYLADNATGISQTASLTAGLGQYDQNSIVATINGYASKAGVSITSFDFGNSTGAVGAATVASAGTVNLTLSSSVKYQNFIIFLRLLEQGLMPAQVINATISPDLENPGSLSVSTIVVKVTQ